MYTDAWKWIVQNRHCKRAFLPKLVPLDQIEEIVTLAANAPSSKNTQPWKVVGVHGERLDELRKILCDRFDRDEKDGPDYAYSITPLPEPWMDRARECGHKLFELKHIDRDDLIARRANDRENFRFFGTNLALFLFLPAGAEHGNFLDAGSFLHGMLLGLVSAGLGACPQYSLCQQSKTIRRFLEVSDDHWLVCGVSVGYPDPEAIVNTFVPERLDLKDYFEWG